MGYWSILGGVALIWSLVVGVLVLVMVVLQ